MVGNNGKSGWPKTRGDNEKRPLPEEIVEFQIKAKEMEIEIHDAKKAHEALRREKRLQELREAALRSDRSMVQLRFAESLKRFALEHFWKKLAPQIGTIDDVWKELQTTYEWKQRFKHVAPSVIMYATMPCGLERFVSWVALFADKVATDFARANDPIDDEEAEELQCAQPKEGLKAF